MTQQGWQQPGQGTPTGGPGSGSPYGYASPHFQGQPPLQGKGNKRTVQWVVLIVVIVLALALAGVALFLVFSNDDGGSSAEGSSGKSGSSKGAAKGDAPRTLPIDYQFNSWLSDGYAAGVGKEWKAEGRVVGTSADRSHIVFAQSRTVDLDQSGQMVSKATTTVYDVASGKQVHQFTDLDCYESLPAIDGKLTCTQLLPPGGKAKEAVGQLDVASGKFTAFYNAEFSIQAVHAIGVRDNRLYAHTRSELGDFFIVFDMSKTNEIIWQTKDIPMEMTRSCILIGEHIGCEGLNAVQVFSAKDGSKELDLKDPDLKHIVWTNEAVIWGDTFAEEFTVSHYDGTEEKTKDFPYSTVHEDAVLPMQEVLDERGFDEFDAQGKEVVRRESGFTSSTRKFVETGAEIDVDEHESVLSSSAGKVVLISPLGVNKQLIASDGKQVGKASKEAKLVDGILVDEDTVNNQSVVYPPAS